MFVNERVNGEKIRFDGMVKTYLAKITAVVLPRIVWGYLHLIASTSKLTVHGSEHPDKLKETNTGFIYAFWHNRQIILPIIRKGELIHCLISSSSDGEYVAQVAELFGKALIRGSTTRGGFEAMKQMMHVLRSKGIVAVTPDGPLGPPFVVKPGVIQMSRALGCPIVPIAFDANRKRVFASWDGFNLPYPFARVAIVFGAPLTIAPPESVESGCLRLKHALDTATDEARLAVLKRP
ncbi:MAG: lysophospholipid acyltransferase family protein [Gammaproteobacteria bacterium]|nr:lysophospholipid acyltransferase family protein [Gammaproteobacteria bacterium]